MVRLIVVNIFLLIFTVSALASKYISVPSMATQGVSPALARSDSTHRVSIVGTNFVITVQILPLQTPDTCRILTTLTEKVPEETGDGFVENVILKPTEFIFNLGRGSLKLDGSNPTLRGKFIEFDCRSDEIQTLLPPGLTLLNSE